MRHMRWQQQRPSLLSANLPSTETHPDDVAQRQVVSKIEEAACSLRRCIYIAKESDWDSDSNLLSAISVQAGELINSLDRDKLSGVHVILKGIIYLCRAICRVWLRSHALALSDLQEIQFSHKPGPDNGHHTDEP